VDGRLSDLRSPKKVIKSSPIRHLSGSFLTDDGSGCSESIGLCGDSRKIFRESRSCVKADPTARLPTGRCKPPKQSRLAEFARKRYQIQRLSGLPMLRKRRTT
jgi:hypothetical protein